MAALEDKLKKAMEKRGHESSTKEGHPLLNVNIGQVELEFDGHGNSTSETAYCRALKIQLESAYPSFIKPLLNSDVNCSLLEIPKKLTARRLPPKFTWLVLEDEYGYSHKVCYLPHRRMLSVGWSKFSQRYCLKESDVLVFQLVEASKFKVYIIKEDKLPEVKEAHGHGDVDSGVQLGVVTHEPTKRKCMNNPPLPNLEKKNKTFHQEDLSVTNSGEAAEHTKNVGPEAESVGEEPNFQFQIAANGKAFDSHFPEETKQKYYYVCCSQNTVLHANLVEGLGDVMIITAISETVRVADVIKSCAFHHER